jgi:GTP-binding protein HflX
MEQYKEKENLERAVLIGVELSQDNGEKREDHVQSMEELGNLTRACFIEPVAMINQKMSCVNKGLYIGTGKVWEVKEIAQKTEADVVIFDDTLTPSQLRNLQDILELPVMDRTALILDIFESRARTREAKLQVEAARLKYLLPRLVGMHEALTRQGGTSGSMSSRGAGEKKIELDRRRIEHRLSELRKELEEVSGERRVQRKKRLSSRLPLVALVGYTNAGKSTIMNAMIDRFVGDEDKKVLEEDMLFATLDTTVRRINTGNNRDFLLSDTVGFIHKLPHTLVEAFKSTLEEVQNADLLVQVVDYSDPYYREQMETTRQTLAELMAGNIPTITVFNKTDLVKEQVEFPRSGEDRIYISAKDDASLSMLVQMIGDKIYEAYVEAELLIPYDRGGIVSYFRENSHMLSQEYTQEGTRIRVKCHKADKDKYAQFICK